MYFSCCMFVFSGVNEPDTYNNRLEQIMDRSSLFRVNIQYKQGKRPQFSIQFWNLFMVGNFSFYSGSLDTIFLSFSCQPPLSLRYSTLIHLLSCNRCFVLKPLRTYNDDMKKNVLSARAFIPKMRIIFFPRRFDA